MTTLENTHQTRFSQAVAKTDPWGLLTDFIRERWPFRHALDIPAERVDSFMRQSNASWWHGYAIKNRTQRRHVCIACGWIADYVSPDAAVFEPGCGSGANLLWLAAKGFRHLSGADIDDDALNMCRALQQDMGNVFEVWHDDCMQPQRLPQNQDIILSVNWLYHVPGSTLDGFLETYTPCLSAQGAIVCDVVDSTYNTVRGNFYHSSDAKKPEHERRPSEYTFRMSPEEVAATAQRHGLRVLRQARTFSVPQRRIYFLAK